MRDFYKFYYALLMYKEQYGHLKVSQNHKIDEYRLGKYVSYVRCGQCKVTEEQRRKLDAIGFIWKVTNKNQDFSQVYSQLAKYVKEYGNCKVPVNYITEDGIRLGFIVQNIRTGHRQISEEERKMLNELGFQWGVKKTVCDFDTVYRLLKDYQKKFGHMHIPSNYVTDDNIKLGRIAENIRYGRRKMNEEQKEKLNMIVFEWGKNLI